MAIQDAPPELNGSALTRAPKTSKPARPTVPKSPKNPGKKPGQITLRIDKSYLDEADSLIEALGEFTGRPASQADVLRMAISIGLPAVRERVKKNDA